MLIFALAGDALLGTLGISIPAFRIAGGILLFLLALNMIFPSPSGSRSETVRQQEKESYQQDISVFPLAIPPLAGPGAITTVLLYTGERSATELAVFVAVLLVVRFHLVLPPPRPLLTRSPSVRPDPTPSRACSACSSQPWASSSSPMA